MTAVAESPLYALGLGIFLVLLFGWLWLQTTRKVFFVGVIVSLALTALLVLLERTIVTEREEIVNTIQQIARDVETNNIDLILSHASANSKIAVGKARAEIPRYQVYAVSVKTVTVEIQGDGAPPTATAEFNAVVTAESRGGGAFQLPKRGYPRFITLSLVKEEGRWKVHDYTHADAMQGFRNR